MTRDSEKIYPKHFETRLPKGLKHYEINGSSDFGFYYEQDQVIFVKVKLEGATPRTDSTYVPTKQILSDLVDKNLSTSGNSRYDIKSIKLRDDRRNFIVDKGDAIIILYNIKPGLFDKFYNEVKAFRYL